MSDQLDETLAEAADTYRTQKCIPSWSLNTAAVKGSASALDQSITDHSGRWLYELFQNAEDAGASYCKVRLIGNLIVATDNSENGVPIDAIESLSNPFVSTKSSNENIGRKGIGFCAVYKLTNAPRIWSKGSGLEFSPANAEQTLRETPTLHSLHEEREDLPYLHALLPFGFTQLPEEVEAQLGNETNSGTSVILPLLPGYDTDQILDEFEELDSRFILTFKHLKHITFERDNRVEWELRKSETYAIRPPHSPKVYRLIKQTQNRIRIKKRYAVWSKDFHPPEEVLATIKSKKDRERLDSCELSIISPVDHSGGLLPVQEDASIFVYYPTEQELPLQLIAHGDFILDISRKHLIAPSEPNSLNHYLLQKLTDLIIHVSNILIQAQRYSEGLQLLKTSIQNGSEDLTKIVPNFTQRIQEELLLPTATGTHTPLSQVIFPAQTLSARKYAIPLISLTNPDARIAIDALCQPNLQETIQAYSKLWYNDTQLLSRLKAKPQKIETPAEQIQWCQCAWTWLSEGFEAIFPNSYYINRLKELKIIPTPSGIINAEDPKHLPCLVSDSADFHTLPTWLRINAVPHDFSLWVHTRAEHLNKIVTALRIEPFSEAFIVKAFSQAINKESYIENPQRHQEAIDFAKQRNWPNNPDLENFDWKSVKLGGLLVPITQSNQSTWVTARTAYFGKEWSSLDLQSIYPRAVQLPMVSPVLQDQWSKAYEFLSICGVKAYPRLTKDSLDWRNASIFWEKIKARVPSDHIGNKRNPREQCYQPEPTLNKLKHVQVDALTIEATTLLKLLQLGWFSYYSRETTKSARFSYHGVPYDVTATDVWFHQLQTELRPPCFKGSLVEQAPLGQLWLKTNDTPEWPLKLFPQLNLKQIDDSPEFKEWILETGLVRTLASDIPDEEWRDIIFPTLQNQLNQVTPENGRELGRVATITYRSLLDSFDKSLPSLEQLPRACWQNGQLRLADEDEEVWAVFSDNDLKEWQNEIPVFQFSKRDSKHPLFLELNYKNLNKDIIYKLQDERSTIGKNYTREFQDLAAWIYADRANESKTSPPLRTWKQLTVYTRESILVSKSVGDIILPATHSAYFYNPESKTLLITPNTPREYDMMAQAIVEALDLPAAQSDRIENLLRMDVHSRRKRMLKDMSEADLDDWLAKYRGEDSEPAEAEIIEPATIPEPTKAPSALEESTRPQTTAEQPSFEPTQDEAPAILHSTNVMPVFPQPIQPVVNTPQAPRPEPQRRAARAQSAATPAQNERSPRQVPKDALDVEDRSREFVQHALEAQGYKVTQMEQLNPGYDIDARKGDEVLFVEVKGNKGPTDTVQLTPTELKTYQDAGNGYSWQLWHVRCLAEDSGTQPEIRIYDSLPQHALSPDVYTLNLVACPQVKFESARTAHQ